MSPPIAVVADSLATIQRAQFVAQRLQLPVIVAETELKLYDFILLVTADYLALQDTRQTNTKPMYVDFLTGKNAWRQQAGGKELLAKAVGYKPRYQPYVIDASAGLGRDAFVLASLGCRVLMLERSAIIAALLQDALARLHAVKNDYNLQLIQQNANDYLKHLDAAHRPEVIYLDPMYPERNKTALVKKEMRILRAIVGSDEDAHITGQTALNVALKRVVVKRPKSAIPLMDKPDLSFSGNHSRFDVYLLT